MLSQISNKSNKTVMLLNNNDEETKKKTKDLFKLEKIGISGKINSSLKLEPNFVEILIKNLDEISLRFLAYLIKGYYMNLKKSYELIYKDIQQFINNYLYVGKSEKNSIRRKHNLKKEQQNAINSLGNLDIFSQFSEYNKYLSGNMDETQLAKNINSICK
jgi:hypothetical protein